MGKNTTILKRNRAVWPLPFASMRTPIGWNTMSCFGERVGRKEANSDRSVSPLFIFVDIRRNSLQMWKTALVHNPIRSNCIIKGPSGYFYS